MQRVELQTFAVLTMEFCGQCVMTSTYFVFSLHRLKILHKSASPPSLSVVKDFVALLFLMEKYTTIVSLKLGCEMLIVPHIE